MAINPQQSGVREAAVFALGVALVGGAWLGVSRDGRAEGTMEREAARWVDRAETARDGVLAWLDSQGRAVREEVKQALAEAKQHYEATLGLWVLAPEDAEPSHGPGSTSLAWSRTDEAWDGDAGVPERVVLLIHGLDEGGDIWDCLAPRLREEGYAVVQVVYKNDQPASASADTLREALDALGDAGVERADLVCHSMGGLIARDVMTSDGRAAEGRPEVHRMIMLGTPNKGSALAPLQMFGEARDQAVRIIASEGADPRMALCALFDGRSEAAEDLLPGSDYLNELNDRPLPDGLAVTLVIGQMASINGGSKSASALAARARLPELARLADDAERWAEAQLAEVGDGVVPVSSARLDGIDDEVLVRENHRTMVRRVPIVSGDAEPPAIEVILDRLAREDAESDDGAE